jgi:hypothetical protein
VVNSLYFILMITLRNVCTITSVTFGPQANYADRATATCRRNLVPTFTDKEVSRGQCVGFPTIVNLSFLTFMFIFGYILIDVDAGRYVALPSRIRLAIVDGLCVAMRADFRESYSRRFPHSRHVPSDLAQTSLSTVIECVATYRK